MGGSEAAPAGEAGQDWARRPKPLARSHAPDEGCNDGSSEGSAPLELRPNAEPAEHAGPLGAGNDDHDLGVVALLSNPDLGIEHTGQPLRDTCELRIERGALTTSAAGAGRVVGEEQVGKRALRRASPAAPYSRVTDGLTDALPNCPRCLVALDAVGPTELPYLECAVCGDVFM